MPLGICRLIRVSFDTKLSAILIFRGIHFGHTAKVNFAEAIVYEKTIVSAFSAVSATSAEFTWPYQIFLKSSDFEDSEFLTTFLKVAYPGGGYFTLGKTGMCASFG